MSIVVGEQSIKSEAQRREPMTERIYYVRISEAAKDAWEVLDEAETQEEM